METNFLILSKNSSLLLKNYIFGNTKDFIKTVNECFDIIKLEDDVVEVRFPTFSAFIYYASEHDRAKGEINGHVLIDLSSNLPISVSEIKSSFKDFVIKTNSYLFLISDQEENLILKSNHVEELN